MLNVADPELDQRLEVMADVSVEENSWNHEFRRGREGLDCLL